MKNNSKHFLNISLSILLLFGMLSAHGQFPELTPTKRADSLWQTRLRMLSGHTISKNGETLASRQIEGAAARDWEDIATFKWEDESLILVADVGDNPSLRQECQLYLVKEPGYNREDSINEPLEIPPRVCGEAISYGRDGESLYLLSETIGQPLWEVKTK